MISCIYMKLIIHSITMSWIEGGYLFVLLVVVRQHLIGSQVLTLCPPLWNVSWLQAVNESRPSREIDDVLKITINVTLEVNNKTRANTSYILGHGIEKAYYSPSKPMIGKWPQSPYMYMWTNAWPSSAFWIWTNNCIWKIGIQSFN